MELNGGIPYRTLFHGWSESLTPDKERNQAGSVVSRGFMIYSIGSENLLILKNPSRYRFVLNTM